MRFLNTYQNLVHMGESYAERDETRNYIIFYYPHSFHCLKKSGLRNI